MRFLSKQVFYINSKNADSGTSSNFSYTIPLLVSNEYNKVCLLQCCIPKTYFAINNNTFTLIEKVISTGLSTQVTIMVPKGNYTRDALANTLANLLTNASPHGIVYTVSYPNALLSGDNGFYTFTAVTTTHIPSFIITDLYEPLGFDPNTTYVFTQVSTNYVLTSVNVPKLQPEDTIFIHTDMCRNISGVGDTINSSNDILQEVYANTGFASFSNILFQQFDVESNSKNLSSNTSSTFNFRITNENNEELNFNGLGVLLTVMVYEADDTNRMLRGFIKTISYVINKLEPAINYLSNMVFAPPSAAQ